jgi:hypothetical protein
MRHKLILATLVALATSALGAAELTGVFKREVYQDVLRADAEADPTAGITGTDYVNAIEAPVNVGANFTTRLSGWYTPATSGQYVFFVASDDDGDLFLSTDATPANKKLIAQEAGWSGSRNWNGVGGAPSVPADKRSDTFAASEWTPANQISLTAGTKYWLEAYAHEGGGGDNLAVYIKKVGDPDPNTGDAPSLAGGRISAEAPAATITTQPASGSVSENFPTTLTVAVSSMAGVSFQWQVNGVNIPGATNATYTFTPTLADSGKKYRVVVSQSTTPATVINSNEATLTVTTDTTPPTIVSAGTMLDRNGLVVVFNEPIGSGLGTAGNYAISGGVTVNSAEVLNDFSVFLGTSAMTAGANLTLTISNVRDKATGGGNLVTPNTKAFTVISNPAGTQLSAVGYQRFENTTTWDEFMTKLSSGAAAEVDGLLANMEAPVDIAETHGTRLRGYFVAPKTGNYVFYGHSDDRGAFYLSTDSDPANKKLIATEPVWNGNRAWQTLDRRDATAPENRSSTFRGSEWPGGGNNIKLIGGQKYYAEVLFLEGGGGDNGGLNFSIVGDSTFAPPEDGQPTRMVGTNVTWFGSAANFVFNFSMPASKVFKKGDTVSLEPIVTGPGTFTYQWFKNKKPVAGATSKNLVINNADYNAIGDYALEISVDGAEAVRRPVEEGDDNVRLYMDGITMLIEAEDYNYGGGQHKTEADLPSYRGDAYKGLKSTLNVDFFHDPDNSGGAAFAYQRMLPADEGVIEDKGGGDAVNNALGRNRGSFSVNANYALGWTEPHEWQNYTRTFKKGKYVVIGGLSHDGVEETDTGSGNNQIDMILSKVANPTVNDNSSYDTTTTDVTEGGAQGLTKLGSFKGFGSGAWSSNDMIPLTDDAGNVVQLNLEGLTTLRLTFNAVDGDADWFAFYCLDCAADPGGTATISLARSAAGAISLTFTGVLQSKDTVNGTFTDVAGATSPYTPTGVNTGFRFYRARSN